MSRRQVGPPRAGFSLLTTLIWTFLLVSVALILHLRLSGQLLATHDSDRQLYSFVLAEDGVEYARTLLPLMDLNELLAGSDGRHEGASFPEWRSPMPYRRALEFDPGLWSPSRDDGLPLVEKRPLLPRGYRATGGGWFFLRFSNNPEEKPDIDEDRIVLVRSLGVAGGLLPDPASPRVRNAVTLVEALFRQERVFDLPSAMTLLGDEGVFEFDGDSFLINGTNRLGVTVAAFSRKGLAKELEEALDEKQKRRIRGAGLRPAIGDISRELAASPVQRRVFRASFWEAFQNHLPEFVDSGRDGISYLPEGGSLRGKTYRGLVVARGDLDAGGCRIEGLLLHLGGGRLELGQGCRVKGGVWMSNLESFRGRLGSRPIQLRLSHDAAVVYNRQAIERALAKLPPTQLGWRILFPEMTR